MARVRRLWSRVGNPPDWVARQLGISRVQLSAALHAIKRDSGLSPRDRVTLWDDGSVTDDTDVWIGNIHDEV
jgi:hypothetical protein